MRIEYQVSEDDFASAANLFMRTRSKWGIGGLYGVMGVGVVLILVSLPSLISTHSSSTNWPLPLWVVGIGLICGPLGLKRAFRTQYQKNSLLRERRTLDVDDSRLRFKIASAETTADWSVYSRFEENKQTFLLVQQGNQIFIPIPKRELSEDQIVNLRSLFQTHLPRR